MDNVDKIIKSSDSALRVLVLKITNRAVPSGLLSDKERSPDIVRMTIEQVYTNTIKLIKTWVLLSDINKMLNLSGDTSEDIVSKINIFNRCYPHMGIVMQMAGIQMVAIMEGKGVLPTSELESEEFLNMFSKIETPFNMDYLKNMFLVSTPTFVGQYYEGN
jgi:hypothetical protein